MSESTTLIDGVLKWLPSDIVQDIQSQSDIEIRIDESTINAYGVNGNFEGTSFKVAWVYKKFLVVEMSIYSQVLVEAFNTVLGFAAHFRYLRNGVPVVERDFIDPPTRVRRLMEMNHITEVVELSR